MFMPVSQYAAPVVYAAGSVTPNPPPVIDNAGAIRLTQLAVTGPGAAIISNTVNNRQTPNNERTTPRASQFLAQLLAQSEAPPAPAANASTTKTPPPDTEQFSLALSPTEITREPVFPATAPARRRGVAGKAANAYGAANARNLTLLSRAEIFSAL
ncbi:MAG: hypothetical protein ACK5WQ_00090 [Alphaproteobacteria bacterium]